MKAGKTFLEEISKKQKNQPADPKEANQEEKKAKSGHLAEQNSLQVLEALFRID
jgi:hypothetical protein